MTYPYWFNLVEYNQGFCYYPLMVNLDRWNERCNTLGDPNKSEYVNLSNFNLTTSINETKTLSKHISFECKCKSDGRKYNSNPNSNSDKCWCECKYPGEHHVAEKDYVLNPSICSCENGKYLESDGIFYPIQFCHSFTHHCFSLNFTKKLQN